MRVLLAQINPTVGDIATNVAKVLQSIDHARKRDADLVVFPELTLAGYPAEDLLLLPHFINALEEALKVVISHTKGISVVVGTARRNSGKGKPLYNTAAIITDGALQGFQDKILLPTYDVFDERRFFEPGHEIPIWEIGGKRVAVTICEDIWQHGQLVKYDTYGIDPVEAIAAKHPDLIVNLSASPFSLSQCQDRILTCSRAARSAKAPLLLCNQVGGNDSLIFDGRSLAVDSRGELIQLGKGFAEDPMLVDLNQSRIPIKVELQPIQELHNALVLGIRDYFHKQGFSKACLGLSGGIDSAVVACLAVEALGKENVLGVLMPSRYSSPGSITDAEELAQTLGMSTRKFSIEKPLESYLHLLTPILDASRSTVTEENLQARIRGMILMAISNQTGCLVLNTGNKSELAMGYSTLYGDMCGGLAVINDLTKQQVYRLANWINRDRIIIPENTILKPPSAELRFDQKDSDTLPDYAIVDSVVQAYVEENKTPETIAKQYGYPIDLVDSLIKKIHLNEYKRRQSPPGLRVSQKAFSAGRRFPVVHRFLDGDNDMKQRYDGNDGE